MRRWPSSPWTEGVPLPGSLTDDQKTRLAGLHNLKGAAFDDAYLKEIKRINDEDKKEWRLCT